jgi:hypothetical protein
MHVENGYMYLNLELKYGHYLSVQKNHKMIQAPYTKFQILKLTQDNFLSH